MIKKTRVYLMMGIAMLVNAVLCMVVFALTYREKKSVAGAFWAFAVTFGTVGASLTAIYASKEDIRLRDLRSAIAEKDHWFHSFEYPGCSSPSVSIDSEIYPEVETEEDELSF